MRSDNFTYDSFLKILKPVFVFSAAQDVLLLLLQLRGVQSVSVKSQPGAVGTVRVFEAHYITVLHRCTIISVLGVDLEGRVGIGQPGASCH